MEEVAAQRGCRVKRLQHKEVEEVTEQEVKKRRGCRVKRLQSKRLQSQEAAE
jgi:hypothetical protein